MSLSICRHFQLLVALPNIFPSSVLAPGAELSLHHVSTGRREPQPSVPAFSYARGDLAVPVTRTTRYGPRSFAVAGPSTWNSLSAPLRNCQLSSSFRHELKTELLARAYLQLAHSWLFLNCKIGRTLTSSTHHHHHVSEQWFASQDLS